MSATDRPDALTVAVIQHAPVFLNLAESMRKACDLIAEAALCMKMEGTLEEINATIHAHPTIAEAIREAALDAVGAAFHIPPKKGR